MLTFEIRADYLLTGGGSRVVKNIKAQAAKLVGLPVRHKGAIGFVESIKVNDDGTVTARLVINDEEAEKQIRILTQLPPDGPAISVTGAAVERIEGHNLFTSGYAGNKAILDKLRDIHDELGDQDKTIECFRISENLKAQVESEMQHLCDFKPDDIDGCSYLGVKLEFYAGSRDVVETLTK